MADNFRFAQLQPYLLAGSGAIIGDTTLTLQSMTDIDGNALSMATDFGQIGYGTIEPGNGTNEEQISFSGLSNNSNGTVTLTGVKTVAFLYPYTETSGLAKTHAGATTFVISNTSGFYNKFVAKDDDGTISETLTFTYPNFPQMDGATDSPSNGAQLATKYYVDQTAIAGAPNADTTTKGIVQIATQAQVDAKTILGSTSAYLVQPLNTQRSTLLSDYVIDTSTSPNIITIAPSPAITSYQAGQQFSFKLANTNTSPSVTLNVNGLGAKNIVKLNGSTSPAASDMASGQMIVVEYDGTNFQMLNPVANAPATSAQLSAIQKFGGTGADGALSASSGTTTINLGNSSYVIKNYTSISLTGTAVLAFTNPSTTGTIIVLKSQGDVTLTSSTSPFINLASLGGAGGTASGSGGSGAGNNGGGGAGASTSGSNGSTASSGGANGATSGQSSFGISLIGGGGTGAVGGSAGGVGGTSPLYSATMIPVNKCVPVAAGAGGGGGQGGSTGGGGNGAAGSGGLYIECGGALNFTGTIVANASAGVSGTGNGGGGGGGGAGSIVILYNSLTANTGVLSAKGGAGGTNAGAGGDGFTVVKQNTEFV